MEFELSRTNYLCETNLEFQKLILDYPELENYRVKYDEVNRRTSVEVNEYEVFTFIEDIDEDILISLSNKRIIINDKVI